LRKSILGETTFWKAVAAYVAKHTHSVVETHHFRSTLEEVRAFDFLDI
jgi:aminopeptidase N